MFFAIPAHPNKKAPRTRRNIDLLCDEKDVERIRKMKECISRSFDYFTFRALQMTISYISFELYGTVIGQR